MVNKKKPTKTTTAKAKTTKTKAVKPKAVKGKVFTKKELGSIKNVLVEERTKIFEEILSIHGQSSKSLKDASGDLSGYSFHMADMATDLYEREFSLELAEGDRERLFALDEAIKRIDDGIYGVCEACDCKISKPRLEAMPHAKNCIKCQQAQEKA